ncbi:DUF6232 family protein [Leucothrix arctica]|uniref:Uncharacterized protein n=1 Tax=Leucothrix arctica TaxID=1481894 RepID=A0A317CJ95_9GAMM|nr:DUF6232 family protein [Leucothrix arctica]PWQ97503.1 hypothetical protein DKT75_06150 [Leucothrix arctica]
MSNQHDKESILEVNVLKVRGNALIFDNTIYQISNITSVQLSSSSKSHENPLPEWVNLLWVLGVIILFLVALLVYKFKDLYNDYVMLMAGLIGIILILVSYLCHKSHVPYTKTFKYGLSIELNSGKNQTFISNNELFIKDIVTSLYQVISDDESRKRAVTYNFKTTEVIQENNFTIESVNNSNFVGGNVDGDVVNNI